MQRLRGARVYLDTNIFIAFAEGMAVTRTPLVELFDGADVGEWKIVTSDLMLAKALVRPYRLQQDALVDRYELLLAPRQGLVRQPVDADILRSSARLSARHKLKLPMQSTSRRHCDVDARSC